MRWFVALLMTALAAGAAGCTSSREGGPGAAGLQPRPATSPSLTSPATPAIGFDGETGERRASSPRRSRDHDDFDGITTSLDYARDWRPRHRERTAAEAEADKPADDTQGATDDAQGVTPGASSESPPATKSDEPRKARTIEEARAGLSADWPIVEHVRINGLLYRKVWTTPTTYFLDNVPEPNAHGGFNYAAGHGAVYWRNGRCYDRFGREINTPPRPGATHYPGATIRPGVRSGPKTTVPPGSTYRPYPTYR